jgi:hypothetical protein
MVKQQIYIYIYYSIHTSTVDTTILLYILYSYTGRKHVGESEEEFIIYKLLS